jgi:lactoylglutathione lyase
VGGQRHGAGQPLVAMTGRPFQILGVQQIALGGLDRRALELLWADCLGLGKQGEFRSAAENVDEAIFALGRGLGRVELDLMQPVDPNARPAVHTPALNHIGLWVDDLRRALCWLVLRGVRFTPGGIRRGASGHDVCFIHPKASSFFPVSGQGVLIELVQAPAELVRAYHASPP